MKKPIDVGAAGIDEVDAEPEVERRAELVGEAPGLHKRPQACRDAGVLAVGEGMLVGQR